MQLPEIKRIEKLSSELRDRARFEVLAEVGSPRQKSDSKLPIYKVTFGTTDPQAPVLGLVGGIHGLERIGAQVCLALLHSLSQLILWDKNTQKILETLRIFFIPTVNPVGIYEKTRSNPRGVDLMRNAPIESQIPVPWLLGGHRISPRIPWYRGGNQMEVESEVLVKAVESEIKDSKVAVTVDFHSGYGWQDQLWFPYSSPKEFFPDLANVHSFKSLLEQTYPYHFYKIEPPAYQVHGDLWDYIYHMRRPLGLNQVYLPLTLEMGSWTWLKKNPMQFFSAEGPFNPIISHRLNRTLRRHNTFFEFLIRAVNSPEAWAFLSAEQKTKHESQAKELWYGK